MTGKMSVLSTRGHDQVTWTEDDSTKARRAFEAHLLSGGAVVQTKPGPETQIRDFPEPQADTDVELIAFPQIAGG
jgi:hypothetical protein